VGSGGGSTTRYCWLCINLRLGAMAFVRSIMRGTNESNVVPL